MAKKTTKSKTKTVAPAMATSKSIDVEKISNGYIVSTWTEKGKKATYAKTKKEVKNIVPKMLG